MQFYGFYMRKIAILSGILILGLIASLALLNSNIKNNDTYTNSWTKAICDENNYCQDYEIFCKGKELVSISPITGAAIQFSEHWEDPRGEETRDKIC